MFKPFLLRLPTLFIAFCLLCARPAGAHEFWMISAPFNAPAPTIAHVDLYVGQFFDGDLVPLTGEYVTGFQRWTAAGSESLMRWVPPTGAHGTVVPLKAGSQILAIDTHPNFVKLSPDQFTYYLADEGLADIRKLREERKAGGKDLAINRERYRRHIKALIGIGEPPGGDDQDAGVALLKTGQRLEIVPLADPRRASGDAPVGFQILFEGRPLPGVLLKAWHRSNGQTVALRAVASAAGVATLTLPFKGVWMLSAVHMLPVKDDPALDWESLWANLTFQIP